MEALYTWRRAIAGAVLILGPIVLFIVLFFSGPHDPQTIWVKQARSPDGRLTAVATHLNWDGPGNNDDEVDIVLRDVSGRQTEILEFTQGGWRLGDVTLTWRDNHHLDVGYKDEVPSVQTAQAWGVNIATHAISN